MPKVRRNDLQGENLTCFQNNKKGNDCICLCEIS